MRLLLWVSLILSFNTFAGIEIIGGWVKKVPENFKMTAGFGEIKNTGKNAIEIVSASSEISEVVELHTHKMVDGVMKMRKISGLKIMAGTSHRLKPGGDHIMFIKLKKNVWKEIREQNKNVTVKLFDKQNKSYKISMPLKDFVKKK